MNMPALGITKKEVGVFQEHAFLRNKFKVVNSY